MAKDTKFNELTLLNVVDLKKELGRGSYGRVFAVKYCGTTCAAKEIHSILLSGAEGHDFITETFLQECHQCSVLRHPNLVQFLGVYYPVKGSALPVMVMEMMDDNLTGFFDKNKSVPVHLKWSVLHDLALGLQYLHCHDPPVIHRDLSPNNVLLTSGMVAKIGDLGVAKVIKVDKKTVSRYTRGPGTLDFMSPEALQTQPKYGTALDVFSYAGIVLFVATHTWPGPTDQVASDPKTKELKARSEVERRRHYIDQLSITGFESMEKTVVSCLNNDPADRPSIIDICGKVAISKDAHKKKTPHADMNLLTIHDEFEKLEKKIDQQSTKIINDLQAAVDKLEAEKKKDRAEASTQTMQHEAKEVSTQTDRQRAVTMSTEDSDTDYVTEKSFMGPSIPPVPMRRHVTLPSERKPQTCSVSSLTESYPPLPRVKPVDFPAHLLQGKNSTPLVTALQSGNYRIKWTKCTELPFPMSYTSVVVDKRKGKIYVTAGGSPNPNAYNKVFSLNMTTGEWDNLAPSEHRFGILQIIAENLCIIGGSDVKTRKSIKKVSTYDEKNDSWIHSYPDMLSARFKPGVVTYNDHVVVLGGTQDNDNINNDIEVFNWRLAMTQKDTQWERSALTLPVPMWGISPIIADEYLYIVGYTQPRGTSNRTYRLSISLLIFLLQQPHHAGALDRQVVWSELSRAPYFFTALVPELYPPIIMGGGDNTGNSPTSDICLYDMSGNSWKQVASLPMARLNTAVATIDDGTVIVFGGYTNGKTTRSAMDSCITTVEIGQAESYYYI